MASEWKRLTMQNGAWVATVTALVAGALLWYERPAPLYPTTRDEAEVRFALLERYVASAAEPFATVTNVVGFYPARWFWTGPRYESTWTVPAATWTLRGSGYEFVDLWSIGGINGLQRDVADYEFIVTRNEEIGDDWWQTNIYADSSYFGDYQYLHTNTLYMSTNILRQVGRALSAMRWTLENHNYYMEPDTKQTVFWYGGHYTNATLAGAWDAARAAFPAVEPSVPLDGLTNLPLAYHYAEVSWYEISYVGWRVNIQESARFEQRLAWAPAATNVAAWHVGAFSTNGAPRNIDEFYHPAGVTGTWEIASVPLTDLGGGTYGFAERLFDWHGRIPQAEIEGRIPPKEEPY